MSMLSTIFVTASLQNIRVVFTLAILLVLINTTVFAQVSNPELDTWLRAREHIDKTIEKTGMDEFDIAQPQWEACGYSTIGRMPIIDEALSNPVEMPEMAIHFDNRAQRSGNSISELYQTAREMGDLYEMSEGELIKAVDSGNYSAFTSENLPDDVQKVLVTLKTREDLPEDLRRVITVLIICTAKAAQLRDSAFSGLTKDEIARIEKLAPQFFLQEIGNEKRFRAYTVESLDDCVELVFLLMKVDWEKMIKASEILACGIDFAQKNMPTTFDILDESDILFSATTSIGRIVLGNVGENTYTEDCAVLIDLGGNDIYLNNAGGTRPTGLGASVVLDISGNDTYRGIDHVQAAGFGGIGALIDLSGDDSYIARHYSQCSSLGGISLFYDASGDDVYKGDLGVQCFSIFGYSIFCEAGGNDTYTCNSMGQGFASTLGVSLMCEFSGNDVYRAGGKYGFYNPVDSAAAQGAASGMRPWPASNKLTFYGGVAMLSDMEGDDKYLGLSFVQGASYIFALGMLVDSSGNDFYTGESYTLGCGCHVSAGVFVDRSGNDIYQATNVGMGYSLDRSAGVFFDASGNDIYNSNGRSCGAAGKPRGIGLFVDANGDDSYINTRCGYARASYAEHIQSTGLFYDFSGNDVYTKEYSKNDTSWQNGDWGFGEDLQEIEEFSELRKPWKPQTLPNKTGAAFLSTCTMTRFSEIGRIVNSDKPFAFIADASSTPICFADLEIHDAIEILRINDRIGEDNQVLANLLQNKHPNLRLEAVRIFRLIGTKDKDVIKMMADLAENDTDRRVRSMALLACGKSQGCEVSDVLIKVLKNDKHPLVRRSAAMALGENVDDYFDALITAYKIESSFKVRTQIIASLGRSKSDKAHIILESALKDESSFVRLEASLAIIQQHKDKAGVLTLIELIDQPELSIVFGSRGIPLLRDITGISLKGVAEWSEWWKIHADSFDLEAGLKNREIVTEAERLFEKNKDFEKAEELLKVVLIDNPEHLRAIRILAKVLNGHAWSIALSGENIKTGLKLMKECLELVPANPDYIDTYAVLLYLSGDTDLASKTLKDAMEKLPNLSDSKLQLLKARLKQIKLNNLQLD